MEATFPVELMNDALPAPWGSKGQWLTLSDGAAIWYTACGEGAPLVLLHGWRASARFWQRNVPQLAQHFRVIVPDLRGHGASSKTMQGHTIMRYARDVRELCLFLGVERPVVAGWSMSGSIALEYWRCYGQEATRGIATIDSSLAPFADGGWNAFRFKDTKSDGHSENMRALRNDPEVFAKNFLAGMFGAVKATPEELDWMSDEVAKTPPWIATAIHSDYVLRNYERVLPTVSVPTAVFAGAFGAGGLAMGKHFADCLPQGRYHPYPHCGHMPFYEDAHTFNAQLMAFCHDCA